MVSDGDNDDEDAHFLFLTLLLTMLCAGQILCTYHVSRSYSSIYGSGRVKPSCLEIVFSSSTFFAWKNVDLCTLYVPGMPYSTKNGHLHFINIFFLLAIPHPSVLQCSSVVYCSTLELWRRQR